METFNESDKQESLYKIRDVGATLNDTFAYFRKNFGSLFLPLLLIVWPLKVVCNFILKIKLQSLATARLNGTNSLQSTWSYLSMVFLFTFLVLMISGMANMIVVVYMRDKEVNKIQPSLGEILSGFLKKLPKIFIVGLITWIMILVGTVFLFIPGIYLGVVFSIALPVAVIDNKGVFESIGRCFTLINERFWSTFGLVIIMLFIVIILNLLGQIPTYIVTFSERLGGFGSHYYNPDPYSARHLIPLLIDQFVNTLTYAIYIVSLTIWYYSLVEEKDGVNAAILLDTIKDKQVTGNEGDF